jgi:hypothetical protein
VTKINLTVLGYLVLCIEKKEYTLEFAGDKYDEADGYLNAIRRQHPDLEFGLVAVLDV